MKPLTQLAVCLAAGTIVFGCSFGDAPSGMSETDAKSAIARMSPEQKIRAIASSPMEQGAKDAEYAKIEAETGVKAKDVLGSGTGPGRG
jgi:hypothetical protein